MTQSNFTIGDHVYHAPVLEPGLYVVPTPIGNLRDITLRALDVLSSADVIACEDTRTTAILLRRYGIDRPRVSYNEHNADTRGPDLLRQISEGAAVALVSDAGTPLVSDPGARLVARVVSEGHRVIPLPGASAPVTALMASGFVGSGDGLSDDFRFCGFLPSKQKARRERLEALAQSDATTLYFESPSRLLAALEDMGHVFGPDRAIVVARELTKMHETFHRGNAESLKVEFAAMDRVRGEIVIAVSAASAKALTDKDVDAMLKQALQSAKTKQAAKQVAQATGRSAKALYERALALKTP
ncbi:MAG: 16S rRNA (cytidine(1402)-2'-O)-methyltransferase [Pseudomonadota bacterium]